MRYKNVRKREYRNCKTNGETHYSWFDESIFQENVRKKSKNKNEKWPCHPIRIKCLQHKDKT